MEKLPPIDFTTFILSLASSAQIHLGLMPNPSTDQSEKNLTLAKQTIDLLDILQAKTKGNLTKEEGDILNHVLYELRMQFVEANK